jgi:hypothetical protein
MRPKNLVFSLVILLGFAASAKARLGETMDQLVVRYGVGAKAGAPSANLPVSVFEFHKQNWTITVWVMNGISVGERLQKAGGPTADDISTLLTLNAEGHTWKESVPDRTWLQTLVPALGTVSKAWVRDDGAYAFTPSPLPYCLTIKAKALVDAEAADDAAKKKAGESSLKGF